MIRIVLATEDQLSEEVGLRLASEAGLVVGMCLRKDGNGYLRKRIPNFCEMALQQPVFLITDLDQTSCPTKLMKSWLGTKQRPAKLLFRVAVREIESWLLADHEGMRELLGPKAPKLPNQPDALADPKEALLNLAQRATRSVRDDLVATTGSVASQGLGYNARLGAWIRDHWKPARAADRSPSLAKARNRLRELTVG